MHWAESRETNFYVLLFLIATGAISLLVVAGVCVRHFSEISDNHTAWADFGSYFGGLGGTIIAALAVNAKLQLQQLSLIGAQKRT